MKRRIVLVVICVAIVMVGVGAYLFFADQIFPRGVVANDSDISDLTQLAYGTLALEETEYAVTEEDAQELLTLWEMAQTLVADDATADSEKAAIYRSIEAAMTDEQMDAIGDLKLDSESIQEYANADRTMGDFDTSDLSEEQLAQMQERMAAMGGQMPTGEGAGMSDMMMNGTTDEDMTPEEAEAAQQRMMDNQAVRSVITYLQGILGIEPERDRTGGFSLDGTEMPFAPEGGMPGGEGGMAPGGGTGPGRGGN